VGGKRTALERIVTMRALQFGFLAVALTLGGCAGLSAATGPLGSTLQPAARSAAARRLNDGKVVFVAELSNVVPYFTADIHATKPPELGQITDGINRAVGIWVDRKGTLYVTNSGGSVTNLEEYKRGSSMPFKTITNGLYTPGAVAADASGNVYVADFGPTVLVYAAGSSSPTKKIAIPYKGRAPGIGGFAFTPTGDVLVATFDVESQTGAVYSITPGSWQITNLNLQQVPGDAIGTDHEGNIYVGGVSGYVSVFAPGSMTPSRSISVAGGAGFYSDFFVTPNGTIYWPNYDNKQMYEFAPGASSPTTLFPDGGGVDVAVGLR
jgi:hypothetical protein